MVKKRVQILRLLSKEISSSFNPLRRCLMTDGVFFFQISGVLYSIGVTKSHGVRLYLIVRSYFIHIFSYRTFCSWLFSKIFFIYIEFLSSFMSLS